MDIYSLTTKEKVCFTAILCVLIGFTIFIFFTIFRSVAIVDSQELQLQIISTEYSEPTISTINGTTYYKPAQFKVTFKDNVTDSYYSTDNKDVYEYLKTQDNFIYNTKILQEKENKIMMQITFDNKKISFIAIKTIEGK